MKVGIYSAKQYEQVFFEKAAVGLSHELKFMTSGLTKGTAALSKGCSAICCFVTDQLNADVIKLLNGQGIRLIALRSAGYDHVDLQAAKAVGLTVVRVPAYSPHAIAEFAVGLILVLSRKITRAHDRVRLHNFSLEGQLGFNIQGKTVGIIGTGNIGTIFSKIMSGFDCRILAYDPKPNDACKKIGVTYTTLQEIFQHSDIISLHCLLNDETQHIINRDALAIMNSGVMLINTGRGALIDTPAVIESLKDGKIGALGIDVYENETPLFFKDYSDDIVLDDQFVRLQAFPNIIITGHQAYLSEEALKSIADTTLENITAFEKGTSKNLV